MVCNVVIVGLFTFYFVGGGNDGFAAIWVLLGPAVYFSIFGLGYGTVFSSYFALMLIFFCWTPGRELLLYEYSEVFLTRFPMTYFCAFAASAIYAYRLKRAQITEFNYQRELKAAVEMERERVTRISLEAIMSMKTAIEAKNPYTKLHSERVSGFSALIARELGWDEARLRRLENMSLLHDIGKIGVPDCILNKPGKLTDIEYSIVKEHTTTGHAILSDITTIEDLGLVALNHHERYDGKGYPGGLSGDDIPIDARIVDLADTIDAMNSDRTYRSGMTTDTIVAELLRERGRQFDPELADVAVDLLNRRVINCDSTVMADEDAYEKNSSFCTLQADK